MDAAEFIHKLAKMPLTRNRGDADSPDHMLDELIREARTLIRASRPANQIFKENLALVFGPGGVAVVPCDPIIVACNRCGKLDTFTDQFDAELAASIHAQKCPSHIVTGKRKNVRLFKIQGDL